MTVYLPGAVVVPLEYDSGVVVKVLASVVDADELIELSELTDSELVLAVEVELDEVDVDILSEYDLLGVDVVVGELEELLDEVVVDSEYEDSASKP